MTKEIWKSIPYPEYAEFFEISNLGNVRCVNKDYYQLKILYTKMDGFIYLKLVLSHKGVIIRKGIMPHIEVAKLFVKNDKPYVNGRVKFIDGNKNNIIATNLEWESTSQTVSRSYEELRDKMKEYGIVKKSALRHYFRPIRDLDNGMPFEEVVEKHKNIM